MQKDCGQIYHLLNIFLNIASPQQKILCDIVSHLSLININFKFPQLLIRSKWLRNQSMHISQTASSKCTGIDVPLTARIAAV